MLVTRNLTIRQIGRPFRILVLTLFLLALSPNVYGQEVQYYRAPETAEHDHWIVSVGGVPAIIIRARPEFPDTESRARDTAQKLREAFNRLRSSLNQYQKPVAGFAIENCAGTPCINLMGTSFFKVTPGDAVGYQSRDEHGRPIDSRMVAEYWRALLQDIALLNNGQEPTTLKGFEETRVLENIYQLAKQQGGDESAVNRAIASLDDRQKRILEGLAYQIPHDFQFPDEISQIQPQTKVSVALQPASPTPTPEGSGLSQTAVTILKKILGLFALLILFGVVFVFGRRIFGSKRISLTLALNAGERELESKEFVLQPLEEISLRQTGGDQRWAVGSPDSIRNVSGKLFRISSDGNPPERLRVGSQIKIPPDGPVQRTLAVKALGRA